MSMTIEVYSEYSDADDNYADYSTLLKSLPTIAYYPPEQDDPNFYYQGVIICDNLLAIQELMSQLVVSIELSISSEERNSDMLLLIKDSM